MSEAAAGNEALEVFLRENGWAVAAAEPFAADWSQRRYTRLRREDAQTHSAILMQAAPDKHFMMFVRIAALLRRIGASAPRIYAADSLRGFMLLEDFGEQNFGRMIDAGADARALLLRATDALIELHKAFVPAGAQGIDLPVYDAQRFIELLQPFLDNLAPALSGGAREDFSAIWRVLLALPAALPQTLMLRDFMADNLMDLPGREGRLSVGLLDFELAGIGPAAYDLASLTEQVRRDIPEDVREAVLARYLQAFPGLDGAQLADACAILSLQRHMRILGMLGAPDMPQTSPRKAFVPRIRTFMKTRLARSALSPLKGWVAANFPEF
ncbi:MAG: phosphotransferase [Alphaproteobacteria bacterium]|nr:phosphotransferase [Alphaproteobacteria bacterium]